MVRACVCVCVFSSVPLEQKPLLSALKRELLELQGLEEKLSALSRLLSEQLDRLGDDRPPSGLPPDTIDLLPTTVSVSPILAFKKHS